jgi:hypothetical protein
VHSHIRVPATRGAHAPTAMPTATRDCGQPPTSASDFTVITSRGPVLRNHLETTHAYAFESGLRQKSPFDVSAKA